MATSLETLERAAELKGQLVEFTERDKAISKHLGRALRRRFGNPVVANDYELITAIDVFALQDHLPDGKPAVEHFCRRRRDLSDADRAMLLGWRDVVEGIFEIESRPDRDGVVETRNVLDDLHYRITSNGGPATLAPARRRGFLTARIVPLGTGDWMLSGCCSLFPRSARQQLLGVAAELAMDRPELIWRNRDKLAQAWQLQRRDRELFLAYFGADLVVIPGDEVQQRWNEYWHWRLQQPTSSQAEAHRAAEGVTQPAMDVELGAELCHAETVGIIYDETEGLTFLADFDRVRAAFTDPDLADQPDYRHAVLGYLHDDSVSTLPFRRFAAQSPERASETFARALNKPKFSWDRDGEALLRKYKPSYVDKDPRPRMIPLSDELARALRAGREGHRARGR